MSIQVKTDQDFREAIVNNKQVIVKYFADWCGSCKLLAPKFKRLASDERFKAITFIEVNAEENSQAKAFLKELGRGQVVDLPFVATFKDGELVEAHATSKEEVLMAMLHKIK